MESNHFMEDQKKSELEKQQDSHEEDDLFLKKHELEYSEIIFTPLENDHKNKSSSNNKSSLKKKKRNRPYNCWICSKPTREVTKLITTLNLLHKDFPKCWMYEIVSKYQSKEEFSKIILADSCESCMKNILVTTKIEEEKEPIIPLSEMEIDELEEQKSQLHVSNNVILDKNSNGSDVSLPVDSSYMPMWKVIITGRQ